ncbi:hypothetical protein CAEBREN_03655 [Caenorhabditis brenneri]|uniref:Uncharacterized protein n=1 Tax=Caenorhabditis brenneri TaxID=135651 RepID=G0NDD1_CAEBE|nr:hypothetical protein CAEBREN_03655 [Caenorhabditis brenneri]
MCRQVMNWFPEGTLATMMVYVLPNWRGSERFGLEFRNLRLKGLPKADIELLHQPSWSTVRARFQLSEHNATTSVTYSKKYERELSVEQFYFVEYGIVLEYPELQLVVICDSGDSRLDGELFPQEVVNVIPFEN